MTLTPGSLKMTAFRMSYKVNESKINAIFAKKEIVKTDNLSFIAPDNIKVGVAHVAPKRYKTLNDYILDMEKYVEKAAKSGVQLLSFPNGTGLLPLMLLPNADEIIKSLHREKNNEAGLADYLYPILEYLSDYLYETFITTFANLANSYGIYIMAGSAYLYDNGKIICRSYLFDENGQIIGVQNKLHQHSKFERVIDLSVDDKINIFNTKIGKIAMLISSDAIQFECVKIAKNLGADIILCPVTSIHEIDAQCDVYGFTQNSDLYGVYTVVSAMAGDFGIEYFGSSAVYAPVNVTKNKDGILSRILLSSEAGIISARLDMTRLTKGYDSYTSDINPEFYKEHLIQSYKKI